MVRGSGNRAAGGVLSPRRLAAWSPPPDDLGAPDPQPPPGVVSPGAPRDPGRGRDCAGSRGHPFRRRALGLFFRRRALGLFFRRRALASLGPGVDAAFPRRGLGPGVDAAFPRRGSGSRAPWPRGKLVLGLRPGASRGRGPAGPSRDCPELPLLRPRSARSLEDASESEAAPLPLGRNRGPRLRRENARGARARCAPLRRRRLDRRERPAQVARRAARSIRGRGGGGPVDAIRPFGQRRSPRERSRPPLRGQLSRNASPQGDRGGRAVSGSGGADRRAPDAAARAPSGSSTTPPRRPFTGSPAPTSTIVDRAPSRFFRESRHRRSASPPRTIRSCRPSRSSEPAPSCPPRSSSASLATGAISASWRALFRGGRRTGPRRRRSSGWSGGNPGAKKSRGAADPLRRLSSRSRRSCCGSRDARLSRASWRRP